MTGLQVGRLTVIGPAEPRRHQRWWLCRCECGIEKEIAQKALRQGHTKSCGCAVTDRIGALRRTHGMSGSKEFMVWSAMLRRCYNRNSKGFDRYGGRGIAVCDRWRTDFATFLSDMGVRPSELHSIDRLDNNGPYAPDNCQWATRHEQASNTRRNRFLSHQGLTLTVTQWAARLGIQPGTIRRRLDRGWSAAKAIDSPLA